MSTTTLQHSIANKTYSPVVFKTNPIPAFIAWCTQQQENRLLWLAIALVGHGCIITPITIVAGMWNDIDMTVYAIASAAIVMNVIVNLSALPTKITIPVFLLSVLVDIAILVYCFL